MRRRSRRSARRSITSPHTPEQPRGSGLRQLIETLPPERRRSVFAHSSWVAERGHSYERLEFLGDSVLGLAITRHLYQRFPDRPEGELARMRAHVVSRASCAAVGRELGLAELFLREATGPPPDAAALAASDTVIAEVVEAGIGACFLEVGLERVADAVVEAFAGRISYALDTHVDHKTVLQEQLARQGGSVTYSLVETSGPDHDRRFTSVALVEGAELGRGSGGSKKASEQEAAREALEQIARAGR
jgi:ribonuclease III